MGIISLIIICPIHGEGALELGTWTTPAYNQIFQYYPRASTQQNRLTPKSSHIQPSSRHVIILFGVTVAFFVWVETKLTEARCSYESCMRPSLVVKRFDCERFTGKKINAHLTFLCIIDLSLP